MTRAVSASTEIDADIATVWSVLVDVDRYPEWNPFTVSVATTFELGTAVDMRVALLPSLTNKLLPSRRTKQRPPRTIHQVEYITGYEDGQRVSWGANIGPAWFIQADRWQLLTGLGDGRTLYETSDEFTGIGVGFMLAIMERHMKRGFDDVARALKSRAESLRPPG